MLSRGHSVPFFFPSWQLSHGCTHAHSYRGIQWQWLLPGSMGTVVPCGSWLSRCPSHSGQEKGMQLFPRLLLPTEQPTQGEVEIALVPGLPSPTSDLPCRGGRGRGRSLQPLRVRLGQAQQPTCQSHPWASPSGSRAGGSSRPLLSKLRLWATRRSQTWCWRASLLPEYSDGD